MFRNKTNNKQSFKIRMNLKGHFANSKRHSQSKAGVSSAPFSCEGEDNYLQSLEKFEVLVDKLNNALIEVAYDRKLEAEAKACISVTSPFVSKTYNCMESTSLASKMVSPCSSLLQAKMAAIVEEDTRKKESAITTLTPPNPISTQLPLLQVSSATLMAAVSSSSSSSSSSAISFISNPTFFTSSKCSSFPIPCQSRASRFLQFLSNFQPFSSHPLFRTSLAKKPTKKSNPSKQKKTPHKISVTKLVPSFIHSKFTSFQVKSTKNKNQSNLVNPENKDDTSFVSNITIQNVEPFLFTPLTSSNVPDSTTSSPSKKRGLFKKIASFFKVKA